MIMKFLYLFIDVIALYCGIDEGVILIIILHDFKYELYIIYA